MNNYAHRIIMMRNRLASNLRKREVARLARERGLEVRKSRVIFVTQDW